MMGTLRNPFRVGDCRRPHPGCPSGYPGLCCEIPLGLESLNLRGSQIRSFTWMTPGGNDPKGVEQ